MTQQSPAQCVLTACRAAVGRTSGAAIGSAAVAGQATSRPGLTVGSSSVSTQLAWTQSVSMWWIRWCSPPCANQKTGHATGSGCGRHSSPKVRTFNGARQLAASVSWSFPGPGRTGAALAAIAASSSACSVPHPNGTRPPLVNSIRYGRRAMSARTLLTKSTFVKILSYVPSVRYRLRRHQAACTCAVPAATHTGAGNVDSIPEAQGPTAARCTTSMIATRLYNKRGRKSARGTRTRGDTKHGMHDSSTIVRLVALR